MGHLDPSHLPEALAHALDFLDRRRVVDVSADEDDIVLVVEHFHHVLHHGGDHVMFLPGRNHDGQRLLPALQQLLGALNPALHPILGLASGLAIGLANLAMAQTAPELPPIFDAHIHFSHDAAAQLGVEKVISLMRQAGLKRALVSSSDDEGTQKLLAAAPDLIIPSLRPYRLRSDVSTWVKDPAIISYLEQRLARYKYAAIGEFHLYGADVELPVPRRLRWSCRGTPCRSSG